MLANKQQFNVYLSLDLINKVKHQAINEQLSLSDLLEKILTNYMKGKKNERSK